MKNGKFIISLDFELHWGAAEKWDLNSMKPYFGSTRESIPVVLSLFQRYGIHATWATVGFLFCRNLRQLREFLPGQRPTYQNALLNYYNIIENGQIGDDEKSDPYHFAASLIQQIADSPNQELATHTFAHYYCTEKGQNVDQFSADIKAAQAIARENFGLTLKSLVFPRNQFNAEYLEAAAQNGIEVVRSNPDVWFWKNQYPFSPLVRALDTLVPVSGTVTYDKQSIGKSGNVTLLPASRFLRPYRKKEDAIQQLKINRIKSEMSFAAKEGRCYHLWWHPHNFGYETQRNLNDLEEILVYFNLLREKHGFASATMIEMKIK